MNEKFVTKRIGYHPCEIECIRSMKDCTVFNICIAVKAQKDNFVHNIGAGIDFEEIFKLFKSVCCFKMAGP